MTNQEIFELMDRFEHSSIQTMRLSSAGFSLELSRSAHPAPQGSQLPAPAAGPSAAQSAPAHSEEGQGIIAAPLAGLFYAAPEPGATPFVQAGDRVSAGQTVCMMEAMKMISEIPAPCDCIITDILKENGTLAAYDEPIFRYRPC